MTGRSTHPLIGAVATPAWSPEGRWLVFGLAPIGTEAATTIRVWQMRPDGSGLRQLTEDPSSFPVWVTDEP